MGAPSTIYNPQPTAHKTHTGGAHEVASAPADSEPAGASRTVRRVPGRSPGYSGIANAVSVLAPRVTASGKARDGGVARGRAAHAQRALAPATSWGETTYTHTHTNRGIVRWWTGGGTGFRTPSDHARSSAIWPQDWHLDLPTPCTTGCPGHFRWPSHRPPAFQGSASGRCFGAPCSKARYSCSPFFL